MSVLWTECLVTKCHQNSHVEALTPGAAVFGGGASKEVIKVK